MGDTGWRQGSTLSYVAPQSGMFWEVTLISCQWRAGKKAWEVLGVHTFLQSSGKQTRPRTFVKDYELVLFNCKIFHLIEHWTSFPKILSMKFACWRISIILATHRDYRCTAKKYFESPRLSAQGDLTSSGSMIHASWGSRCYHVSQSFSFFQFLFFEWLKSFVLDIFLCLWI